MRQEPCKVYGHAYPANERLFQTLRSLLLEYNISECVELEGDILQISFEGVFFPVEEVVELLCSYATEGYNVKVDALDLEGWTLSRFIVKDNDKSSSKISLNHVLDYSGH